MSSFFLKYINVITERFQCSCRAISRLFQGGSWRVCDPKTFRSVSEPFASSFWNTFGTVTEKVSERLPSRFHNNQIGFGTFYRRISRTFSERIGWNLNSRSSEQFRSNCRAVWEQSPITSSPIQLELPERFRSNLTAAIRPFSSHFHNIFPSNCAEHFPSSFQWVPRAK